MAYRLVFIPCDIRPYYTEKEISFDYYPGFNIVQKQKSITSLGNSIKRDYPNLRWLEISSKSIDDIGVRLSAFNLKLNYKGKRYPVECVFQGSKVFEKGGPYQDLYYFSPRDAKRDERIKGSGKIISFSFFDSLFPIEPKDFFYNSLYISALTMEEELSNEIMKYDAFSDIEFNPKKSLNCQARAAAMYVGLKRNDLLKRALSSKSNFLNIVYSH